MVLTRINTHSDPSKNNGATSLINLVTITLCPALLVLIHLSYSDDMAGFVTVEKQTQ